jgi:hypothetical protein
MESAMVIPGLISPLLGTTSRLAVLKDKPAAGGLLPGYAIRR